jgi:LacI family transcriptional regulator
MRLMAKASVAPKAKRAAVTLKTVARQAAVSPASVSRAFRSDAPMAAETRQRILAVARKLGYAPDPAAAALRSGRSSAIGLVLTSRSGASAGHGPAGGEWGEEHRPGGDFVLDATQAIERLLRGAGYQVQVLFAEPDGTGGQRPPALEALAHLGGTIVLGGSHPDDYIVRLAAAVPATVLVGSHLAMPAVDCFHPDYAYGAYLATRHLLALARRPVALLNGPPITHSSADKLAGYRRALDEAGRPFEPDLVLAAPHFNAAAGRSAGSALLEGRPDVAGVVAGHDGLALGLVQAAARRGRRCPEDLAVTGFYDTGVALLCDPPLTSVRTYPAAAGAMAAERLLRRLAEPDLISIQTLLAPSLVVRGSTETRGSRAERDA